MSRVLKCANCGNLFIQRFNLKKVKQKYCNRKCWRENWTKNGLGKTVALKCSVCGSEYKKPKAWLKRQKQSFCSYRCHDFYRQDRDELKCENCGKEFTCRKSLSLHLGIYKKRYCSWGCRLEHNCGENHPFWLGGSEDRHSGKEWKKNRKLALERDSYRCKFKKKDGLFCWDTEDITVHHIIPYKLCKSHDFSNLETLCRKHHGFIEIGARTRFIKYNKQPRLFY